MKYLIWIFILTSCAVNSIDNPESIDKFGIRATIRNSVLKNIIPCYEKLVEAELLKNKNAASLEGQIVVHFEIDPNGKSRNYKVEKSEITSPAVSNCIQTALEASQFPIPPAGQEAAITYPFIFSPKN